MNNQGLKTAIVFGATGLIGSFVVRELLQHKDYAKVKTFVRTASGLTHEKLEEHIIDFTKINDYQHLMTGDEVYSCFGNNITQSNAKHMWHFVDAELPVRTAEACRANDVKACAVVSSIGARANSGTNYLRLKGEMEEHMQRLGFSHLVIVRPSFVLGRRKKIRWHEEPGRWLMQFFGLFMFGPALNFKGIHARTVARAMIEILNRPATGQIFYTSGELRKFGA